MISFACRNCGQRFDRPDASAGSLVFCTCGIANTVPYESQLPPLEAEERALPRRPIGYPEAMPAEAPAPAGPRCLNHRDSPPTATCPACGEGFCADCVIELEGRVLCGPCKNLQARSSQRTQSISILALLAPLVALLSAIPCLMVVGVGRGFSAGSDLGLAPYVLAALVPQAIAAFLGGRGLQVIEASPRYEGRGFAITGLVAALVMAVVVVSFGTLMANTPR